MSAAPAPLRPAAPLTAEQLHSLYDARLRMKRIRRAVSMAMFDGWTIAVFAILTFLGGIWGASGFVIGAILGAIAFVELRYADRLRRLDPESPKWLAVNQIILAFALITYALWRLLWPDPIPAEIQANARELKQLGIDFEGLNRSIQQILYFGLIAVAVFAQGSMALFYFRRTKMVREYLTQTPAWIVQMQQAGVGV